jgi:hypothetical protein
VLHTPSYGQRTRPEAATVEDNMKIFLAVLVVIAVGIGLAYNFGGIKLGLVTITPARMWNAQGQVSFAYLNGNSGVVVTGDCEAKSGNATLRLLDPDGLQVGGQVCPKGKWLINGLTGNGKFGTYKLTVDYQHYTGSMNIKVAR